MKIKMPTDIIIKALDGAFNAGMAVQTLMQSGSVSSGEANDIKKKSLKSVFDVFMSDQEEFMKDFIGMLSERMEIKIEIPDPENCECDICTARRKVEEMSNKKPAH